MGKMELEKKNRARSLSETSVHPRRNGRRIHVTQYRQMLGDVRLPKTRRLRQLPVGVVALHQEIEQAQPDHQLEERS